MPKIPFVGSSYIYNSLNFDSQRSVNYYAVQSESGTSRDTYALNPTPGKNLFANLSLFSVRGGWEVNGRCFFVTSNLLYELDNLGNKTLRGTLTTSFNGKVSMSDNGGQLCIVDGTDTGGYILDLVTNNFNQIVDPYFLGAVTVVFLGGYFVFNKPNSSVYYICTIYDGLTGDPTEFAVAEGSPDNLTALVALHNQIYLAGSKTTEVIYNSGDADFPLAPISGTFMEYGTASAFAITATANAILWIKQDVQGNAMVFKSEAYSPVRVSTNPIETRLAQYDMTNAVAYTYQEDGHTFYCINAPQMPTTLCYDIELNLWHERAFYNTALGQYTRDRADCHVFCFGKHLVGDYENGNIYEQSLEFMTDNGTAIRRQRTLPYVIDDLEYIYFRKFQIDMQTGTGDASGNIEDTNPEMTLDWSDDNSNSFNGAQTMPIGGVGQYILRVIFRRLGRGRARVFRLTTSTAAKCFLIAAHVEVAKGGS